LEKNGKKLYKTRSRDMHSGGGLKNKKQDLGQYKKNNPSNNEKQEC